jgi:type IV pilus assembly protein PilE
MQRQTPFIATRRSSGFTLIEMLVGIAIAAVLSGIAYPSFESALLKARRSDALVALMQVQSAQERWRSNQRAYGSLAEIGLPTRSAAGHYTLQVTASDAERYEVVAQATGAQARDATCRALKLTLDSATVTYSSGPDPQQANPHAVNRRCWNL